MRELREEKERHARTKEDLGKARSALAFVKTQAAVRPFLLVLRVSTHADRSTISNAAK